MLRYKRSFSALLLRFTANPASFHHLASELFHTSGQKFCLADGSFCVTNQECGFRKPSGASLWAGAQVWFHTYSQSGGGSQMEPVNYRCLNCRGVWTHTYTRAPLYCLIGVNNGPELICRFGPSRCVHQTLYLLSRWTLYRIYDCSSAKSIGYQIPAVPLVLICISFSLVPPLRIIKF